MSRVGGAVLGTASAAAGLVIVGMASLYFAAEPETYLKGLRFILHPDTRSSWSNA